MPKGIYKRTTNKGWFKKNHKPFFSWKNKKLSKIHRQKIANAHKKPINILISLKNIERARLSNIGKSCSKKTKEKIGNANRGEKGGGWQGGKSFEIYPQSFSKKLKRIIRKRDNHICRECGIHQNKLKYKLDIHHIDYNKKNCNSTNLITLCRKCHTKTNFKRQNWQNHFNKINKGVKSKYYYGKDLPISVKAYDYVKNGKIIFDDIFK